MIYLNHSAEWKYITKISDDSRAPLMIAETEREYLKKNIKHSDKYSTWRKKKPTLSSGNSSFIQSVH